MTVRRSASGTPVYRCRKGGHCCWPAERVDKYVENVIVARPSRADVAGLIPHEAEVDVAALRDELVVCDARKRGAAQLYARGSINNAPRATITAELDHRMTGIRADLNATSAHGPLSAFAVTDDARRTRDELPIGRKREIARILLTVTLPPLGRGHTFSGT
jgi:hypothetical protein